MLKLVLFSILLSVSLVVDALDEVRITRGQSAKDERSNYAYAVLDSAMRLTESRYGPYKIASAGKGIPHRRTFQLLQAGDVINVSLSITRPELEENTIPIRIPARMGALNYRLLAIHQDNAHLFSDIDSVADLKELAVGLRMGWATRDVMLAQGYDVVNSHTYESTFAMLHEQRFTYVPRGITEVYGELAARKESFPRLIIEPNLVLYIPAPYYVFVSPKYPKLAERLEAGLELMVDNGELEALVKKFYCEGFSQAGIEKRREINVGNTLLPKETPLDVAKYWLDFGRVGAQCAELTGSW